MLFRSLIALMACVLGGFSVLGYRRDAPSKDWPRSPVAKVAVAIAAIVVLDLALPAPRQYELLAQVALIALLYLSLRLKRRGP